MAPVIHVFRHAEAEHNVVPPTVSYSMRDPGLTKKGVQQCDDIRKSFPHQLQLDLIFASPMTRAVHTACMSLERARYRSSGIILLPDLQEVGNVECNLGSPGEEIGQEVSEHLVKTLLPNDWYEEATGNSYSPRDILERARRARWVIRAFAEEYTQIFPDIPDPQIAVVSHGHFLPYLVEDYAGSVKRVWKNGEWRSYEFLEFNQENEDEDACIRETDESLKRHNISRPSFLEHYEALNALNLKAERQHRLNVASILSCKLEGI
ncbi:histidine phosphatase superfamily [Hypoxylon sp. FL0890]|nr:histidine phosphatase superfamily [Hypoxylon sp. FL0890]